MDSQTCTTLGRYATNTGRFVGDPANPGCCCQGSSSSSDPGCFGCGADFEAARPYFRITIDGVEQRHIGCHVGSGPQNWISADINGTYCVPWSDCDFVLDIPIDVRSGYSSDDCTGDFTQRWNIFRLYFEAGDPIGGGHLGKIVRGDMILDPDYIGTGIHAQVEFLWFDTDDFPLVPPCINGMPLDNLITTYPSTETIFFKNGTLTISMVASC